MGTGKLRISQCMIVKNEEKNIEQALSWGKELMWEQIVVDTGSTDRTVEIAERMGAKIYHFTWIDDFSAAKNFAIKQATGTWIVFLDADEYMLPEDAGKVPDMIKKAEKQGLEVLRTLWIQVADNCHTMGMQCRIFKNTPKIRYQKPIHEQLYYNGFFIEGHVLDATTLSIYHTGYTAELSEAKSRRNIRILLREIERRPDDYDVMGYLGDAYRGVEDEKEKAEDWYQKALPYIFQVKLGSERDIQTVVASMLILYERGAEAEQELMELYQKATSCFMGFFDADYILGWFYAKERDFQKGEYYLERAIMLMEQYGTKTYNPMMASNLPDTWRTLALCYYMNGKMEKSVNCCVNMLTADKTHVGTLEVLLRCFKNENPQDVVNFLQKLYNINDISDRVVMLSGAMRAGEAGAGILNALKRYCTKEELEVLEKRISENMNRDEENR